MTEVWSCVEGNCRRIATMFLSYKVDGKEQVFPYCELHHRRVLRRVRQQQPGVAITAKRSPTN